MLYQKREWARCRHEGSEIARFRVACYEKRRKSFGFIVVFLRYRILFMPGGAPTAHELLPEKFWRRWAHT